MLPDTTASLNLNVRSSSADAQDKANQHHMPRGWTPLPGPGVSHPRRPINQLQTGPVQSRALLSPCSDLLTLPDTHTHTGTLAVVMYRAEEGDYAGTLIRLQSTLCMSFGKKGGGGERRRWDIERLHLISVTGHLFAARSMSSNEGFRNNDWRSFGQTTLQEV